MVHYCKNTVWFAMTHSENYVRSSKTHPPHLFWSWKCVQPVRDIKKTKPLIHQLTNLKCSNMSFKDFRMKKQGLTTLKQGVNFSIELSWLLQKVYVYWCVYIMDTFINILPEKTVILFTCTFLPCIYSYFFEGKWSFLINVYQ